MGESGGWEGEEAEEEERRKEEEGLEVGTDEGGA